MSIFTAIGHFFAGLFNAIKRAYFKLSPEQQEALQQGTGFVALINSMLTATVADVRAAISKQFPTLDEAKLEAALLEVAKTFNLAHDVDTTDEIIAAMQLKLASLEGKAWATISHSFAVAFSLAFGPGDSKLKTITLLIEWVYQKFIKKAVPETHDDEGNDQGA